MKKFLFALSLVFFVTMFSCTPDNDITNDEQTIDKDEVQSPDDRP